MTTIQEIEQAITRLSPEDRLALSSWIAEYNAQLWDGQFEKDVATGKLNWLVEEARAENRAGRCTDRC